jgi:hypothetical protein
MAALILAGIVLAMAACLPERETSETTPQSDRQIITAEENSKRWAGTNHLNTRPVRRIRGLKLIKHGWEYDCMECHAIIKSRWTYDRPLTEHRKEKLKHGANRFCINCHHPTNRNAYVDYDGSEIAERDVVLLCAKCHGTIYRDWRSGIHGRQTGLWTASASKRSRLNCIQCHDPHQPVFPALAPSAPPHYPARASGAPVDTMAHGEQHGEH